MSGGDGKIRTRSVSNDDTYTSEQKRPRKIKKVVKKAIKKVIKKVRKAK